MKVIPAVPEEGKEMGCVAGSGIKRRFTGIQIGGDMKALNVPFVRLAMYFLLCFSSCGLFKKTTRTTDFQSFDLSKETDARRLDLTAMQKETQSYSWWKDSIFYQYEVIKEKVDQARATNLTTWEKQESKQEQTVKISKPVENWIYVGIILGIVGFVLIFRRLMLFPFIPPR
ncbi:MAG: hypothetical protein EOP48_19320 [Sphingobacteriales bacterium]|nr:MAG: hypothetical protein EOP48_19320 [Sphingobacteriales bacterium]